MIINAETNIVYFFYQEIGILIYYIFCVKKNSQRIFKIVLARDINRFVLQELRILLGGCLPR